MMRLNDYLTFWNAEQAVFKRCLPAGNCYLSPQHQRTRSHLQILAQQPHSLQILEAPEGYGKSTILRWLQQRLSPSRTECFPLSLSRNETESGWLMAPLAEFLSGPSDSEESFQRKLARGLDLLHQEQKHLLVLIDAGERLQAAAAFDDLLFLYNAAILASCSVSLVIAGNPNFAKSLRSSRSLSTKISLHWQLPPLSPEETEAYIDWHLRLSQLPDHTFTEEAIRQLYHLSRGVPVILNNLAENCLIGAALENSRRISSSGAISASQLTLPPARTKDNKDGSEFLIHDSENPGELLWKT